MNGGNKFLPVGIRLLKMEKAQPVSVYRLSFLKVLMILFSKNQLFYEINLL